MTRDHRRKEAVRAQAAATGRRYLDAADALADPADGYSAARLRDQLAARLAAAGWPVVCEHQPQANALRIYAGPAAVDVGRSSDPASATGDEHPDDPDAFDLHEPLQVWLWAPLVPEYRAELGRVCGVDAQIMTVDQPVTDLVDEIDRAVAAAPRPRRHPRRQ